MKTRIISGAVMIAIVIAVLFGGSFYPVIITSFLALVNMIAAYEMLKNAAGIKNKAVLLGAGIYSALAIFALGGYQLSVSSFRVDFSVLSVVYAVFAAIMTLYCHKEFTLSRIFGAISMPIVLSFAFGSLESTLNHQNGIYYLLMLLNFSAVCDMGAYFVGSAIGRHKLCPAISPKKTVEGAVGGVIASLIVTVILSLAFGFGGKLVVLCFITVPFCALGMIGDLFASSIKRAVGIKDYGTLIPGHGGVLDRVDSILMIAPLLYIFIGAGIL